MNTIPAELEQKFEEVLAKAKFLYPLLNGYNVQLHFKKLNEGTLALAYYFPYKIEVNSFYYEYMKDHILNNTIIHEIAHIVQYIYYPSAKQAHGKEWREISRSLGLTNPKSNNVMTDIPSEKPRYNYRLPNGSIITVSNIIHSKIQKRNHIRCLSGDSSQIFGKNDFVGVYNSVHA